MTGTYNFPQQVAWKTLDLLIERKGLIYPNGVAFYVWQRPGRVVVAFDPSAIQLERVNEDFVHILSTRLHGRLVVRTNSRGIFLQVGTEIPAAQILLNAQPLDLNKQESPWHMPIGVTARGDLWISLIDGDSFLVGGSRGNGKSGAVHGMIQALLRGGKTEVYAWDGKRGAEFGRYIGSQNFHFVSDARKELISLSLKLAGRLDNLRASGYPNIQMHNQGGQDFITPIAFFVDEIAELEDETKETIKGMIKLYRAAGLYPVLATNDPTQSSILVKTNLSTRICFRVPSWNDSMTVLGTKGAESLPQTEAGQPGRGMLIWRGRVTEFQSYRVDYPRPDEQTLRLLAKQYEDEPSEPAPANSLEALAESIRASWVPEMSKRSVGALLGKPYAGSWTTKIDQIIEYLRATTTIEAAFPGDFGQQAASM